ncbi:hypothetical protein FG460_002316 [Yersinia enterocolitica]|nr:hypothetical protein [Yersinia enterocolitica]
MNNLELSNPVAWTDADELADMDCNTYGNIFNAKYIDIHNGRWLPLYSQGYIDSLIAQLEAAQKERDDLKELNCHFDLSIRKTEGVNEVLRSKLEAAERALIKPLPIGELVHRLEGQTYEKWFSESDVKDLLERAQKAEAALSAANEKLSKPVVLPDYRCSPDMHTKQYYETIGFNLGLDACKAVIKTAGFTVEGNADAE